MEKEQTIKDGLIGLSVVYYAYIAQLFMNNNLNPVEAFAGCAILPIGAYLAFREGKKFQSEPI